jgi:pyruvate/2-oxoglutarate dehydrogenase complex dihydrolipoamide acyltransferase (E2) component
VEATDPVEATDAAAELAEAEGVDLRQVVGTGEGGRVLVADVREVVDG